MNNSFVTSSNDLSDAIQACTKGLITVTAFAGVINLLVLTVPLYTLQIFDRVLSSRSADTLILLLVVAGVALFALALLEASRGFVLLRIGTWLDLRLGGPILSESLVASLQKNTEPSVQGLRDLSTIRNFLSGPSIFPIMDAPWAPIFLVVLFLLHPLLGAVSLVGMLVLFVFSLANELGTRKLIGISTETNITAMAKAEAAVRNADVAEAMGMKPDLLERWHRQHAESLDLQARASSRSIGITASSKFIRLFLQISMLSLGAWLVIQNELTPGGMIAGSILMGRALAPVEQAIASWRTMVTARSAYNRLKIQLSGRKPRHDGVTLPPPAGNLTIKELGFVYPNSTGPVLRNINFQLLAGEALGLVGPTAAGKTTLARLLVRNLIPSTGHVLLDGVDVTQWEADDLGPHLGYLPQDIELFSGTVKENIARMGDSDDETVIQAATLAGVHQMILGLPNHYDTQVGEKGSALSGGQRQGIGLARAVFGSPRVVVLDEPNSNLDHPGETALLSAIQGLKKKGTTVVVIAHRPNILQSVDKILVLRNKAIGMFGPPSEVIPALMGTNKENAHGSSKGSSPETSHIKKTLPKGEEG